MDTIEDVTKRIEAQSPYAAVDRDFALESRKGTVSPGRVLREMALNAAIHSAPNMRKVLDDVCAEANRDSFRYSRIKGALWDLLFALHARPRPGYALMTVEDAIAAANQVLDEQAPGARE